MRAIPSPHESTRPVSLTVIEPSKPLISLRRISLISDGLISAIAVVFSGRLSPPAGARLRPAAWPGCRRRFFPPARPRRRRATLRSTFTVAITVLCTIASSPRTTAAVSSRLARARKSESRARGRAARRAGPGRTRRPRSDRRSARGARLPPPASAAGSSSSSRSAIFAIASIRASCETSGEASRNAISGASAIRARRSSSAPQVSSCA